MEKDTIDTIDNGEIANVHLAPIGNFTGSDVDGNPVKESLTVESLQALADKMNADGAEALADVDHQSSRPGASKDTSAAGWWHKFVVDPVKGLFANLKLTKKGKELIENREYRYVSPTFILDEEGRPVDMPAASLTNLPAFKGFINPIINTQATQEKTMETDKDKEEKTEVVEVKDEDIETTGMATEPEASSELDADNKPLTRDDIIEIVKEVLAAQKAVAENACSETEDKELETSSEAKNEASELQPEAEDEVVKAEALNSSSQKQVALQAVKQPEWAKLRGKDFFKWLREHPEVK